MPDLVVTKFPRTGRATVEAVTSKARMWMHLKFSDVIVVSHTVLMIRRTVEAATDIAEMAEQDGLEVNVR